MSLLQRSRKFLMAAVMILFLTVTTACGAGTADRTALPPGTDNAGYYSQIERGNTNQGQDFGNWVVQTSKGLIQDAYVRDNNKLGVVISRQVQPTDVRPLAKSLLQGFRRNYPERDLTVLMYAPDKKLILTARYNAQSKQVEYQ